MNLERFKSIIQKQQYARKNNLDPHSQMEAEDIELLNVIKQNYLNILKSQQKKKK